LGVRVRFSPFVGILLLLVAACSRGSEAPVPAASQQPTAASPPLGLLAELSIPEPRRFWSSLRKLGGHRAASFTSNFELAFFFAFGLPPRVAGYVRSDTPVVGVVVAPGGAAPELALGLLLKQAVRDPGELERGMQGLLELTRLPAPAGPLEAWTGTIKVQREKTSIPGIEGPVLRAEIVSRLAEGRIDATIAVFADLKSLFLVGPRAEPSPVLAAVLELALSPPACAALLESVGSP
jgi:hypothetical protein